MSIETIAVGVGICLTTAGATVVSEPAPDNETSAIVSPPGWDRWTPKGFSGAYRLLAEASEVRVPDVDSDVYCQTLGKEQRVGGHSNYWWLLTADDSGENAVWINALSVRAEVDNHPVPGVPGCPEA